MPKDSALNYSQEESALSQIFDIGLLGRRVGGGRNEIWVNLRMSSLQYLYPFEIEGYRESTRAIRVIGRDCIQRKIKAMKHGEPPCNNILAHIIGVISEWVD